MCRKAVSEMMDELYVDLAEMARMYSFELTGQYSEGETEVQVLGNEEQVEKEIVKKKKDNTHSFIFLNFNPLSKKSISPHEKPERDGDWPNDQVC